MDFQKLQAVLPSNFAGWIGIFGVVTGALWTLWVYTRNNRVKTAELLLQLEKEYSKHIPTFLTLEYEEDFKALYRSALAKQIKEPAEKLTAEESKKINQLENALRFFFVSLSIKWLRLDSGYVERLNAYYLRKLRKYPELSRYVEMYWPHLFYWSDIAARPLPIKLIRYIKQIPARWCCYWHGSDNLGRRGLLTLAHNESPSCSEKTPTSEKH